MIESRGIFWEGRSECIPYGSEHAFPVFEEAFRDTALERLSEIMEVPTGELTSEEFTEYLDSLLTESEAAKMLNLHPHHRLWPQLLSDSDVNPEFTFKYRHITDKTRANTADIYSKTSLPKLLIASRKYDKPDTARTIAELADTLQVAPAFIMDILSDEKLTTEAFRDPTTLEFDEYLSQGGMKSVLLAVRNRRAAYSAHRNRYLKS